MGYIEDYIETNFSEDRRKHTYAVAATAADLAGRYGADLEKVRTAALFHDMFRGVSEQTLNFYVKHLALPEKYRNNVNLAHGKIAAIVMRRDYGIDDMDILNAVGYHTTGRAGMSTLEKIIYLADAIEPGRRYPGVERIRTKAFSDLDEACLLSLEGTIQYVSERGYYLDQDTVLARDYLKMKKERMHG